MVERDAREKARRDPYYERVLMAMRGYGCRPRETEQDELLESIDAYAETVAAQEREAIARSVEGRASVGCDCRGCDEDRWLAASLRQRAIPTTGGEEKAT